VFRGTVVVSENHAKPINTLCGQNAWLLNIKASTTKLEWVNTLHALIYRETVVFLSYSGSTCHYNIICRPIIDEPLLFKLLRPAEVLSLTL
jgi:hypothetical protein